MRLLLKFVGKYKISLLLLILSFMLTATFQVWIASFVAEMTGALMTALGEGMPQKIYYDKLFDVSIKLLLMSSGTFAFMVLCGRYAGRIAIHVSEDIRRSLYEKTMTFSLKEMDYFTVPSIINRSTADVLQVQGGLFMLLTTALPVPMLIAGGLWGIAQYHNSMMWLVILGVVLLITVFALFVKKALPLYHNMAVDFDSLNRVTREGLSGVQILRALNREEWNADRIRKGSIKLKNIAERTGFMEVAMQPVMYLILNMLIVLILWLGGTYVGKNIMNVTDIAAYISYTYMIMLGLIMASTVGFQIPIMSVSMKRIGDVLSMKPSIVDGEGVNVKELDNYDVKFDNVSFRYSDASGMVVRNISFTAKQGELTVIVGNTGCGKTTLMQLIPRLYDVSEGSVSIGGADIRDMKLNELRSLIGYVPQKSFLYSGDIRSNIAFRDKSIGDEDVKRSAELSQSMQFIKRMKKGFAEWIAQGGSNVSGGQRQRLTIARALSGSPKILILDDSASALDLETGLKLRDALRSIMKDITIIFVTQRQAFIKNADRIVVMQDGEVRAVGTHEELEQSCNIYQDILQSQIGA